MKAFFRTLPVIGTVSRVYRKFHRWKVDPLRNLRGILHGRKNLDVVQIGANDGLTDDPIHSLLQENPSWKALLVEPVPFLFERLRTNYRDNPNVQFANVAIGEQTGESTFYHIDPAAKDHIPDLPGWFDQIGSFDRDHIHRHFGHALDAFTLSVQIPTFSLSDVLDRHHVTRIDLLHIDTEGHEWKILRQLDFTRFHPEVIFFEHRHLSQEDKKEALAIYRQKYRITDLGSDFLCRSTSTQ